MKSPQPHLCGDTSAAVVFSGCPCTVVAAVACVARGWKPKVTALRLALTHGVTREYGPEGKPEL